MYRYRPTDQRYIYYVGMKLVGGLLVSLLFAMGLSACTSSDNEVSGKGTPSREAVDDVSEAKPEAAADDVSEAELSQALLELEEKSLTAAQTWAHDQVPECEIRVEMLRDSFLKLSESHVQKLLDRCTFDFLLEEALNQKRSDWVNTCRQLMEADLEGSNVASVAGSLHQNKFHEFLPEARAFWKDTDSWASESKQTQDFIVKVKALDLAKEPLVTATDYLCPQYSVHTSKLDP